jgi:hypothetical protein
VLIQFLSLRLKISALNLALDRGCRSVTFKTSTKNYFYKFFCLLLFEGKKIKSHKEVTKSRNECFSY